MHTKPSNRRRGVAIVWTVISALVLILFLGLALDTGYAVLALQHEQNSADAAALAGAREIRHDSENARVGTHPRVRDTALALAYANPIYNDPVNLDRNDANDPAGDVVVGRWDRSTGEFRPTTKAVRAVKVVVRRPLPLIFGPIVNLFNIDISRTAIAMAEGGTGSGIIALNPTKKCALDIQGSVFLDVDNGAVQVNSDDPCAFCVTGNSADTTAPEVNVVGGAACTEPNENFDDAITEDAPFIEDPLAGIPDPPPCGAELGTIVFPNSESKTLIVPPGTYSGGISMNNNSATLILEPGIYCLDGVGLDIRGGSLFGEGVMLYIYDSTPGDKTESAVYLGGNGIISLTPPDPDLYSYPGVDTYEDITIFQARANTSESTIIGTNQMNLEGTLYFPSAHLRLGGTGDGFGNQLIADTIELFGSGIINIQYDGRDPAPGIDVFLVH